MPTAADRKFWTANPSIWVALDMTASVEYDCQLVFETNDTAVLNAIAAGTLDAWVAGFHARRAEGDLPPL